MTNSTQKLLAQILTGTTPAAKPAPKTGGSKTGAAISGVKIPKTVNPKSFFSPPPKIVPPKKKAAPLSDPYSGFLMADPYNPTQIGPQAQSDYDADVARARGLAAMGLPTADQINAQAAQRAQQQQDIAGSLSAHLAGIQQASIAQGNAGTAALGTQNAATAATGNQVSSALGVPNVGVQGDAGARAVLAGQTAAGGNYYGSLQAAALQGGSQNAQRALDQGHADLEANDQTIQRTLASLLSGIDAPAKRVSSMTTANQQVDAANVQTKLSVYTNLVNQQQYAQATGSKEAINAANNALKKWETQQSNATKKALNIQDNTTRTTIAGNNAAAAGQRTAAQIKAANARAAAALAAKGKTGGGTPTAASIAKARNDAVKILQGRNKTGQPVKTPATYQFIYTPPEDPNPYAQKPTPKPVTVSAQAAKNGSWKSLVPHGATITQPPVPKTYTTAQKGRTGWYNLWNQALATYTAAGVPRSQAVAYLKQFVPKGSVPGVR